MPIFVCEKCGGEFRSKQQLHEHSCTDDAQDRSITDTVRNFSLPIGRVKGPEAWFAIIVGVLFVGSTLAYGFFFAPPSNQNERTSTAYSLAADTAPPTGRGITRAEEIPEIDRSTIPQERILTKPLSREMQVYLLTRHLLGESPNNRQAILLQYTNLSTAEREQLESIGRNWSEWVYVAPYPTMETRLAYTAFQYPVWRASNITTEEIESFICQATGNAPARCIF